MIYFYIYIFTLLFVYLALRYYDTHEIKKFGQGESLFLSIFWPCVVLAFICAKIIPYIGKHLDNIIRKL